MLRGWLETYQRWRFAWLLGLLLAAIGADPALEAMGLRGRALEWLLVAALGSAVAGVGTLRTRRARVFVAAASAMLAAWLAFHLARFGPGPWLRPALLGATGLALAAFVLSGVLAAGRVDAERISAALCVYLLAGMGFGCIFGAVEALTPGSLAGARPLDLLGAVYFSFVTLSTLGYGDIAPVAPAARALAVLEAVFGQLYLAVLVARLVTLYEREP
jgi:predicted outer membrane lipoprotein